MIDDRFRIYIDRLKDQQTEILDLLLPPDFLEVSEPDLRFNRPIKVQGKAYLALQELVVDLNIEATAEIPCAICNDPTELRIELDHLLLIEPLSEIQAGVFDLRSALREAILLEVPLATECRGGCPKRTEIEKFLKKDSVDEPKNGDFRPFEGLSTEDYER